MFTKCSQNSISMKPTLHDFFSCSSLFQNYKNKTRRRKRNKKSKNWQSKEWLNKYDTLYPDEINLGRNQKIIGKEQTRVFGCSCFYSQENRF